MKERLEHVSSEKKEQRKQLSEQQGKLDELIAEKHQLAEWFASAKEERASMREQYTDNLTRHKEGSASLRAKASITIYGHTILDSTP